MAMINMGLNTGNRMRDLWGLDESGCEVANFRIKSKWTKIHDAEERL